MKTHFGLKYLQNISLKTLITCVVSFIIIFQINGQEIVTVDLQGNAFTSNLPFDTPYTIKGTIPGKDISFMVLKCIPTDRLGHNSYFSKYYVGQESYRWENLFPENKDFAFYNVRPLRPNRRYQFEFETYQTIVFSGACKNQIRDYLTVQLVNPFIIDEKKYTEIINEINNIINSCMGGERKSSEIKIYDSNGKEIRLEPFKGSLTIFSNILVDKNTDISTSESNIRGFKKGYFSRQYLNNKNTNPLVIPAISKGLDKLTDDKEKEIGKQIITILKDTLGFNSFVDKKLGGDNDKSSIDSISSFISKILLLKNPDSSSLITPGVEAALKNILVNDLIPVLSNISESRQTIGKAKVEVDKVKANTLNILENIFARGKYIIYGSAFIDVNTANTPYISLDVGVAGRFQAVFSNFNQIVTYQAANISLVPVRKDIPFSSYHWKYRLLKAFSFQVGVATVFGVNQNDRVSGSISTNSSILLGAGLRFNRVMKLNYTWVLFNVKDANPIIDDLKLKRFGFLSFSVDMNVMKGFGDLINTIFKK